MRKMVDMVFTSMRHGKRVFSGNAPVSLFCCSIMDANLLILTGFVTKASRFWYRGGDLKELIMPEKDYRKVVPPEQPAPKRLSPSTFFNLPYNNEITSGI